MTNLNFTSSIALRYKNKFKISSLYFKSKYSNYSSYYDLIYLQVVYNYK